MKSMTDERKRIKLELSVEEEERITFLDVELSRRKNDGRIRTTYNQKQGNSGIFCNRKSDVAEGAKINCIAHR